MALALLRLMPRYRLNLHERDGETIDQEGQELPDVAAARAKAVEGIRSLLCAEVVGGEMDLRGYIAILDDSGAICATVTFTEALTIVRS